MLHAQLVKGESGEGRRNRNMVSIAQSQVVEVGEMAAGGPSRHGASKSGLVGRKTWIGSGLGTVFLSSKTLG
jgi:hypothetical protein